MTDGVSVGEVHRRLSLIETDLKQDVQHLVDAQSRFVDELHKAALALSEAINKLDSFAERQHSSEARIDKLEAFNDWVVRVVIGTIITAVLALILHFDPTK